VRVNDFKYRFIDQPGGLLANTVKVDWPILVNLRLDPFERTGLSQSLFTPEPIAVHQGLVVLRVLALRSCPRSGRESSANVHRLPTDAKGRFIQS
jgi:hypothetical protein